MAPELIADLQRNKDRRTAADRELKQLLAQTGTTLMDLDGIGPSGAARLLVEVGDIESAAREMQSAGRLFRGELFRDVAPVSEGLG